MARLTKLLIGVNVAVFALETISGQGLLARFALWPIGHFFVAQFDVPVGFKIWQLVTCGFLHANFLHLAINMYALWMFGSDVERAVGPRHYLILYFASLLSSSVTQLLVVSMMTVRVFIRPLVRQARSSEFCWRSACFFRAALSFC